MAGGEMGALMRSTNWDASPLGPPHTWPQSLQLTLGILLHSRFPMFLWWGPDLICFYNDAYRPSLGTTGKHPGLLGKRAEEGWHEIWHIIQPLIQQVMSKGEGVWFEDQLVPIERNGAIEDVWWTFSYSPVLGESGQIAGVLVVCTETTTRLLTKKKMEEAENRYRELITNLPIAVYTIDKDGYIDLYNEACLQLWGQAPRKKETRWVGFQAIYDLTGNRVNPDNYPIALALKEDRYLEVEAFMQRPDGSMRHVIAHPKPIHDNLGNVTGAMNVIIDVTDRKLTESALLISEEKFRSLARLIPQLIWTTDADGRLTYYSQSLSDYTGLSTQQIDRDGYVQFIHPDEREEHIQRRQQSLQKGEPFLFEHRHRRHDGVYRWYLGRAIPQKDMEGNIQMWVGTSTDIDEIKQHEQQKDDFMKVASHELKTPITTIKGYVQLLLREEGLADPDSFLRQSLSTIDKQVSRLTKLVDDLLDVTKIDMGSFRLNKKPLYICDLVKEMIKDLQATTPSHIFRLDQHANPLVLIDKDRIQQVLVNLFTNATKYSPLASKVIVSIRQEDSGQMILSVQDFGIGIDAKEQDKIFTRFYRVSGRDEKTFPGFGIGLFIVREIITLHGGKVWVESENGQGSLFHFSLPAVSDQLHA
jgi:two-component system sensor histidine kinase VicK